MVSPFLATGLNELTMLIVIRILVGTCFLVMLAGCTTHTHRWKDNEAIRQDLLKLTPLGSSLEEVESNLRTKHFSPRKSLNAGFIRRLDGKQEVVGAQSVWVDIGSYRTGILETTSVCAYWGFNESGKLVEIWVQKYRDGL
jgi:hypothetical protein